MEWFRERRDLIVLNNLRDAFKNQFYGSIEIWRLLGANVTLKYWEKFVFKKNKKSAIIYLFYFLFFVDFIRLFKFKKYKTRLIFNENPLFVEALSDNVRVNGFWLPVMENYEVGKAVLVTDKIEIYNKYKNLFSVYPLVSFSFVEWILSRIFIFTFVLKNFIFLFFKKKVFHPITSIELINIFILQINSIIKFKWAIKQIKPKAYLSIWDWYDLGSVGTSVFKSKGLPTFTFIHGAAGKKSLKEFIPLNADYIFSWGQYQTLSLCELGTDRNKILQCGCPRMKEFKDFTIEKSDEKRLSILILLTAMIDPCFVDDIQYIVKHYSKDYTIHIRLHPSIKLNNLDKKLQSLNIHFLTTEIESIETSISNSDIIIVDTSTAGFDAINMDKPVFVLDSAPVKRPQDIMEDIINYGAAVFCDSFADFERNFHRYKSDPEFRSNLSINRRRFVNDFICDYGDQATKNIIKNLNAITTIN